MKVFLADFNAVLGDVKNHIDRVSDPREADIFVLWQDVAADAPDLIDKGHTRGVKTVVMAHGPTISGDYMPPINYVSCADKYMVWGLADYNGFIKAGIPKEKIAVTGSTLIPRFKKWIPHVGKNIVYLPFHGQVDSSRNTEIAEVLEKYAEASLDDSKSPRAWNEMVTVKTKLVEDAHNPLDFQNPIISNRLFDNHVDLCYDALKDADVVVTNAWSSFIVFAFCLGIPVIFIDNLEGDKNLRWEGVQLAGYDIEIGGMDFSSLKDLPKNLELILWGNRFGGKDLLRAAIYYGGADIENPLENILGEIKKTYEGN